MGGYPNGITLTPDGTPSSWRNRTPTTSTAAGCGASRSRPTDRRGRRSVVAELFHTVPDGVAFDIEGRCYVAHYTPDRIDRVLPDGTVETLVEDWEAIHLNAPTNVAFCGPDL